MEIIGEDNKSYNRIVKKVSMMFMLKIIELEALITPFKMMSKQPKNRLKID